MSNIKIDFLLHMLHKILLLFSFFLASEFIFHTRSFITRVYPKMIRADSSNFNPQEFWNVGCQMGMLCRIMGYLQM